MALIFFTLLTISSTVFTNSLPINNGFSVRFNPLTMNEEVKMKSFGALFAKIPQIGIRKSHYLKPPELFGAGCTNQVAKIASTKTGVKEGDETLEVNDGKKVINLPLMKQPFNNYKIIVATAPDNLRIDNEEDYNPLVVYIVFPDDEPHKSTLKNIPKIYFVNKHNGKLDVIKKEKAEPILIINSNRTVTGLKSNDIAKFVKFKNKLNRYQYDISR